MVQFSFVLTAKSPSVSIVPQQSTSILLKHTAMSSLTQSDLADTVTSMQPFTPKGTDVQANGQHETDKAVTSPVDASQPAPHEAGAQKPTYHETAVPYVIPNK